MGKQSSAGFKRLLLVGGALLALIGTALGWSQAGTHASAQVSSGLDFSMSVANHSDCDTRHGDVLCVLDPGERFTVNVLLNTLSADASQYSGYDIQLDYTGVTSMDNGTTSTWPDCGFPVTYYEAGAVSLGCAVGLPPAGPSTYTGVIGSNDFTCTESGAIKLIHGQGHTDLIDETGQPRLEAASGAETLTISCGPLPTATPRPGTPTPSAGGLPAGGTGGGSDQDAPWLTLGALLALGAAALVLSSWRLVRER